MNNQNNPNRLVNEKSPYLQQHSNNPVDWYPWGEEAFQKAKSEDKPIFSFHWLFNLPLVSCNGKRIF